MDTFIEVLRFLAFCMFLGIAYLFGYLHGKDS